MINIPAVIPQLRLPRHTLAGVGSHAGLRGVPCSSALIVSGKSLSTELLALVRKSLRADVFRHVVRAEGEPTLKAVGELLRGLGGFSPDCVVAIGGGSTIDTAKLMLLLLAPDTETEGLGRTHAIPGFKRQRVFVAIPTTAGSGSEASSAAVFKDGHAGSSTPVVSHDFIPDVCVLDPQFVVNIPKAVMAASMADAVVHAVESYVSIVSNPLAESLAEKALEMVRRTAPSYFRDPQDTTHILNLQIAAYWAGIAQNHCGVGACHALAHQVAGYGIGHGVANGLFLEQVVTLNQEDARTSQRLATLAETAGVPSIPDLIREIQHFGGLPAKLKSVGNTGAFDAAATAERAAGDFCARFNPRRLTPRDYQNVLEASLA